MLIYKQQVKGKQGKGSRVLTSEQSFIWSGQKRLGDGEANVLMENKVNARKKSSGSAHLITLLYKKMTKKRDRKLKISSSGAQLLRTLSIHHLECNDYLLPDETTPCSDSSPAEINLHEAVFSSKSEKLVQLSRDYNKQREAHEDQNIRKQVHAGIEELGQKDSPISKNNQNSHSILNATGDPLQQRRCIKEDSSKTVLKRIKDFGKRIKNAIKEKRKEYRRIALDGVLDKVPSGHKLVEDAEKEKENWSKGSPRKRSVSKGFVHTNKNFVDSSIQRSRSLTESLDRYSHLIESILVREPQKLPVRLNSAKKQDNDFEWRRILRSRSLVESFDRYSRLLEFIPVREPKRKPERSNSIREMDLLLDGRPLKTFGRVLSNPEIRSYSLRNSARQEMLCVGPSEKSASSLSVSNTPADLNNSHESKSDHILVYAVDKLESDTLIVDVDSSASGRSEGLIHPELVNEHDKLEACAVSDDLTTDGSRTDHQHEDRIEIREDQFVLDSHCEAVPISLANYTVMQDYVAGEQQDSDHDEENRFADISFRMVELVMADSDEEEAITDFVKMSSSHHREEDDFSYVRDILNKSGFDGGEDFLAAWQSSYEPVDQLISLGEVSPCETMRDGIFRDQQLLINLVNEVLLEIYESSIGRSTGLSRFCPRVRPMPAGDLVLKEVWAKVSLQRSLQQHINYKLEDVMARDFAKNDGWTNPQLDIEVVGIEVDDLIFETLVDELIFDI